MKNCSFWMRRGLFLIGILAAAAPFAQALVLEYRFTGVVDLVRTDEYAPYGYDQVEVGHRVRGQIWVDTAAYADPSENPWEHSTNAYWITLLFPETSLQWSTVPELTYLSPAAPTFPSKTFPSSVIGEHNFQYVAFSGGGFSVSPDYGYWESGALIRGRILGPTHLVPDEGSSATMLGGLGLLFLAFGRRFIRRPRG